LALASKFFNTPAFLISLAFSSKAGPELTREEHLTLLHRNGRLRPYLQTLDKAGETSQGQSDRLSKEKKKKFYKIDILQTFWLSQSWSNFELVKPILATVL